MTAVTAAMAVTLATVSSRGQASTTMIRATRNADRRAGEAPKQNARHAAGVNSSLVITGLVPVTSLMWALCLHHRDGRHIGEQSDAVLRTAMPGHDNECQPCG